MTDSPKTNGRPTIPQKSVDAQILENHLAAFEVGQVATYEELSNLIGRDVQGRYRYLLNTARRSLVQRGIVFETVRNEGIKRASDAEIIDHRQGDVRRIGRLTGRALRKLACVRQDKLNNDEKIRLHATASHLGVLRQCSSKRAAKAIEAKTRESQQQLPIGKTLDLFK